MIHYATAVACNICGVSTRQYISRSRYTSDSGWLEKIEIISTPAWDWNIRFNSGVRLEAMMTGEDQTSFNIKLWSIMRLISILVKGWGQSQNMRFKCKIWIRETNQLYRFTYIGRETRLFIQSFKYPNLKSKTD